MGRGERDPTIRTVEIDTAFVLVWGWGVSDCHGHHASSNERLLHTSTGIILAGVEKAENAHVSQLFVVFFMSQFRVFCALPPSLSVLGIGSYVRKGVEGVGLKAGKVGGGWGGG